HSARAQASASSRARPGRARSASVTTARMPGTLTPRKSRSLLRYLLACAARSGSASGRSAATTWAVAVSASKTGLVTGTRYREGENVLADVEEVLSMPRQNRVTPYGELIAVPDRGMFWGNRGALLNREGQLARYSRGQAWAICVLSFKGRRRQQWMPGRLTELYFIDEATGLAAGHRPCGECRYQDYQAFKRAWAQGGGSPDDGAPGAGLPGAGLPGAGEIDARLHRDRLAGPGVRRTYQAPLAALPAGTMVDIGGAAWLVHDGRLLAWTPGGYRARPVEAPDDPVTVITPRATVAALAAGY